MNALQKKSIIDAAKEQFGNELPDELIESINGGRDLSEDEKGSILESFFSFDYDFENFDKAVDRYVEYIYSLPEDSEELLFNYLDWK